MINSNSSLTPYSQIQSSSLKPIQNQQQVSSVSNAVNAVKTDSINISHNAKELAEIEREISSRYDVTNLSENERIAMSKELLDNKLISPGQHAVMSFPMQAQVSTWPGYEESYDSNKKVDYLQQSIDQSAFAKSAGASSQELHSREQVISLLENLKGYNN